MTRSRLHDEVLSRRHHDEVEGLMRRGRFMTRSHVDIMTRSLRDEVEGLVASCLMTRLVIGLALPDPWIRSRAFGAR